MGGHVVAPHVYKSGQFGGEAARFFSMIPAA